MEKYHLITGSTTCFTNRSFEACKEVEEPLQMFDVAITGVLSVLLFCSIAGNWIVNNIFRVYTVVKKEGSVSHLCLSHMAASDLVYSCFVTPLTLAVLMTGNRFAIDPVNDGKLTMPIIQVVGFTSEVTRRSSLLFLTIVAVDQMALLYLPTIHKAHFTMVSIKTAVGSCWVASIVFGIIPFMSNSEYSFVADMVSPQWDMIQIFSTVKKNPKPRAVVAEENYKQMTWTFILCEAIPILVPAIFLLLSNMVLILRMDYKKRRDPQHSESPAKKKYDPFSVSTREFAMRIASNLGDIPTMTDTQKKAKDRHMNNMIRSLANASINSLRPITSVYLLCNCLWLLSIGYKWSNIDKDEPYQMFGYRSYMHVVNLVLVHVSIAMTPLLHFLSSGQMRQGLVVMMAGYTSVSDFKNYTGLRKRSKTSLNLR